MSPDSRPSLENVLCCCSNDPLLYPKCKSDYTWRLVPMGSPAAFNQYHNRPIRDGGERNNAKRFYSVGTLRYYPPHFNGIQFLPASFASSLNGITQYFSDRRFTLTPGSFINYPFNPNNTDPLTITISPLAIGVPIYSIDLKSSKWGFDDRFVPSFDVTTKILYGSVGGNTFLTVSLCNQNSQRPIVIQ